MISNAGAKTYWFCSWLGFYSHYLTVSEFEERAIILAILATEEINELAIPSSFLDRNNTDSEEKIQSNKVARLEPNVVSEKDGKSQSLSEAQLPISSTPLIKLMTSSLSGIDVSWVFTIADPDPIPSIPHGHYKDKDNPEPKLNPYTGKAFVSSGNEVKKLRLTKKEMVILWDSPAFQDFCTQKLKDFVSKEQRWRSYLPDEYLDFPEPWKWNKDLRDFWRNRRNSNHH